MDSKEQDNRLNAASAAGQPEGTVAMAGEATPTDWSVLPVVQGNEDSVVMVLWRLLRQEPALIVSAGYVLLSLLGLWSSYFFFLRFQLSILDYLQISDFLVAGLRDPAYAGILAGGILLAILVGWPDTLRRRNPAKVEALRARHWGWRVLFSRSPLTTWDISGVRPLTGCASPWSASWRWARRSIRSTRPRASATRAGGRGSPSTWLATARRSLKRRGCSAAAARSCSCGGRNSIAPKRCRFRPSNACNRWSCVIPLKGAHPWLARRGKRNQLVSRERQLTRQSA